MSKPLIGRRVQRTTNGYGQTPERTRVGVVQAVGLTTDVGGRFGSNFRLLVLVDGRVLETWDAEKCTVAGRRGDS